MRRGRQGGSGESKGRGSRFEKHSRRKQSVFALGSDLVKSREREREQIDHGGLLLKVLFGDVFVEREGFEISHGSRRRISLRLVCTGGGPRRLLEYLFVVKSPLGAIEAALPSFSWKGVCSLVHGLGLERKRFTSQGVHLTSF